MSCGLTSYAATPHSRPALCPYCDAELFPAARHSRATVPTPAAVPEAEAEVAAGSLKAEAA
jgi:hypothetical protein